MTAKEIILNAIQIDRKAFESGCGHAGDQFDILVEEIENYHKSKVNKLSKADVIKSVCLCDEPNIAIDPNDSEKFCTKCGQAERQTVL